MRPLLMSRDISTTRLGGTHGCDGPWVPLGVLLMTIGLYRWGIPALPQPSRHMFLSAGKNHWAIRLSIVWHQRLQQCRDPERLRKLDRIAQAWRPRTRHPLPNPLTVVDNSTVNAFAAPGGQVVILRGLLEQTTSAEQLAGVLAHELQHVYLRHSTRAILEQTAGTLLLTAVSGNLSGGLAWGLQGAQTMGALHYSRSHEEEADIEGLRMMQAAHLDPTDMIAFYGTLQKSEQGHAGPPDFLRPTPTWAEGFATLRMLAGPPTTNARRLLPGEDWTDIRTLCRVQAAKRSSPDSADLP